ncbi:hypothetical protein NXK98_RS25235 [Escherichia coli]|nr:hypothetical protein [Escherichia coli]
MTGIKIHVEDILLLEMMIESVFCFFLNYGDNFSLRYDYTQSSDGIVSCWYSNHEDDKMNIIVDADTEQFIPLGSCLPPDITLSVIKDFFKNPLEKSKKVKWMNADDIDWSSVY